MRIKKESRKGLCQLRQDITKSVGSSGNPSDYHPRMRIGLQATHHPSGCHPNPTQSDPVGALLKIVLMFLVQAPSQRVFARVLQVMMEVTNQEVETLQEGESNGKHLDSSEEEPG
ncbi:hypothetical protein K435DRAFT_809448 [Dendrothele bispora CBS 962.96]|uniref:Uncharacterized protein n=1 Tax=Dendrothele bispora (strain CBS 962.96) TaxID=1314807 RepID=A0A4S8KY91_DENBC|nr:hypothetical protein K435DRAFT_809448 [Dendrothele bispora CBS 962.96]